MTPSGYPKRGPPPWSLIPPLLGGLIGQNHRTESYPRALREGSDQKWVQKGVLNGVPKVGAKWGGQKEGQNGGPKSGSKVTTQNGSHDGPSLGPHLGTPKGVLPIGHLYPHFWVA